MELCVWHVTIKYYSKRNNWEGQWWRKGSRLWLINQMIWVQALGQGHCLWTTTVGPLTEALNTSLGRRLDAFHNGPYLKSLLLPLLESMRFFCIAY